MDAVDAAQAAVRAGLVIQRSDPLNCEAAISGLMGGVVMPSANFYIRNHFEIPRLDPDLWRLEVGGLVDRPLRIGLRDLHKMPVQTQVVTLECAGNGRSLLSPAVEGEQWGMGAVSTAEWTGVSLAEVLDRTHVAEEAHSVLFRGADRGAVAGHSDPVHFERSLTLDEARDSPALLAYAMNGEPLPAVHGFPLRLVVPGWYGVASVKWLTAIELVGGAFHGFFQHDRYFYEWPRGGQVVREPVTLQRVRALITEPQPNVEVDAGDVAVRGVAWSGLAPVARVDLRIDQGGWVEANLIGDQTRYGWQRWERIVHLNDSGQTTIRARATDSAGRTQPEEPEWNRLGYGSNSIQAITIRVV